MCYLCREKNILEDMPGYRKESHKGKAAELTMRIRAFEQVPNFSRLKTEVRDLMTDRAEALFDIRIRKELETNREK